MAYATAAYRPLVNKLRTDNETAAVLNKNTNSSFLSVIKNPVLLQLSSLTC